MKNIIKYVLCLSLVACIVVFSCLSVSASSTGVGKEEPVWGGYLPLNSVYSRYSAPLEDEWGVVSIGLGQPTYDGMVLSGEDQVYFSEADLRYFAATLVENDVLNTGYISSQTSGYLIQTAAGYDIIDVPCLLSDIVTGFGVTNDCHYQIVDEGELDVPEDCIVSANIECYLTGSDGLIPCQLLFDVNYFENANGLPKFSPFFGTISNSPYVGVEGSVECVFTVDGELVEFIIDGADYNGGIVNLLGKVRNYIVSGPVSEKYNLDFAYNEPALIRDMSVEYQLMPGKVGVSLDVYEQDVGYEVGLPDLTIEQIQVNVFDWLLQGIAGVLGTPLFGENSMTLGSLLMIAITLPLVFGVLKIFAGG